MRSYRALTPSVSEQAALSDFGRRQEAESARVRAAEMRVQQRTAAGREAMARNAEAAGTPRQLLPTHHERILRLVAQANPAARAPNQRDEPPSQPDAIKATRTPREKQQTVAAPDAQTPRAATPRVGPGERADAAADTAAETAAKAVIRSGERVAGFGETCERIAQEKVVIGTGAFGVVFRGVIPGLGQVAVKRLDRHAADDELLSDFLREVAVLQLAEHPNLMRMLGCGVSREARYLVYPFMGGGDLLSYLSSSHPTSLQHGCRLGIVQDVVAGLSALHSHSPAVLHRDLKPQNVLISMDGIGSTGGRPRALLSDFGLSRFSPELRAASHLTSAHMVGTLGYRAPEVLSGHYSTASDVYSLGVVLLQCVTGRHVIVPTQGSARGTGHAGGGQQHLSAWARDAKARRDSGLVDPRSDFPVRVAESLVCIGLDCSASAAAARPSLDAVSSRLAALVRA